MIRQDKLIEIVGSENVINEIGILTGYSKDMSLVNAVMPNLVVKPGNTEDVIKIMKLAKETLTPLVPVSSGAPHFRGDTVPGTGGAFHGEITCPPIVKGVPTGYVAGVFKSVPVYLEVMKTSRQ